MFPFSHLSAKPPFSFKGQDYILFTAEPRTCSLLLLHAESLNNPLVIFFLKGTFWLEGYETLVMQGGAVQPHGLAFPECGLWNSSSLVLPAVELGVSSSCHCKDERLPMYINIQPFSVDSITFLINRHTVIFQVSHLGLTDVSGFFWAHC